MVDSVFVLLFIIQLLGPRIRSYDDVHTDSFLSLNTIGWRELGNERIRMFCYFLAKVVPKKGEIYLL